jgi:hypothetical protein
MKVIYEIEKVFESIIIINFLKCFYSEMLQNNIFFKISFEISTLK